MGLLRKREQGGAAVEFTLVFPLLFALIYGVITYSYLFLLSTSVNYAAQLGAESAVAVAPQSDADDYSALVDSTAKAAVSQSLSWLQESQRERVLTTTEINTVTGLITVVVNFDMLNPTTIFPVVDLPLAGPLPRFPDNVTATAVVLVAN